MVGYSFMRQMPDMPMRSRFSRAAILVGAAWLLSACAERLPDPTAAATPIVLGTPAPRPHTVARARRLDHGCARAKVDLPQDRKEALFRQFDAALGPAAAIPSPAPSPPSDCRQASR